jgi:hypothetical protein
MALDADDGPSYHRPRFRLVSGLSHDPTDPVGDARVELIVEMIVELSEERRDFDVPCVGGKSGFSHFS